MRPLIALALASVAGCGWNHLPHQDDLHLDAPLWDPQGVVATTDGLYVPLPHTGHLAWVQTDGSSALIDGLRPASLGRLVATPDQERAVAFLERYFCRPEDELGHPVRTPDDCPAQALEVTTQLAVLDDGEVGQSVEVPRHFNEVAFSSDGRFAIAWLDVDQAADIEGVVSLTSVRVLDLENEESWTVGVGFAANRILFAPDGSRAVVLSRSEVAVIDLTTSPPERQVTFPLTLDPDHVVDPVGVELTPSGRYALISVRGSGDLYVLDLDNPSVNLAALGGAPAAMAVDLTTDQTVLPLSNRSEVEVLEHEFFETETLDLDETMNSVIDAEGMALLYDTSGGHDAYRLDLETLDLVEYRLENPAVSMHLAPTREYAVALTRAEGGSNDLYDTNPGLEILELREGEDDTSPYLLEGQGVGAAFVATDTSLDALILQQGVDYLYRLDLYTLQPETLELEAPPIDIGSVPDGPFYITHASGTGLISFLNPANNRITTASNFATLGLLDGPEITIEEEE